MLPDGGLVRTGMGAMAGGKTWQLYRHGYGPSWDAMFCQSNFGIVTKLGLWLMSAPESVVGIDLEFDQPDDLGWVVDTIAPLRRDGILQQSPSMGSWLRCAEQWANATARFAAPPIGLGHELVRQWRGGLGALVLAHSPALAIVRWDKAMVLEGLAREAGLRTRRTRLSRAVLRIAIG